MTKRTRRTLDGAWRGAYGFDIPSPTSYDEAIECGMQAIDATVPGSLETDLERAGILLPIFRGENVYETYRYETAHYCLSRTFSYEKSEGRDFLVFEGIDCFADIYVDGIRIGACDNMLYGLAFPLDLTDGEHELFVHIRPAVLEARKYPIPPQTHAQPYNLDSLYVRKAPHQYGWDIMPRIVSCGIWKHVFIESRPACYIRDAHFYTLRAHADLAEIKCAIDLELGTVNVHDDCYVKVHAVSGESVIDASKTLWHSGEIIRINVPKPRLWWPRNYGAPNVYVATVELYVGGKLADTYRTTFGIRTIELDRTSTTDADGSGEFCFRVNGQPVFAMGTNWVPVDAIHARDEERLPTILPMLNDIGCNIVRCWGGNVYENDLFYDFCDNNGILVWQDFAMACAIYPQDSAFTEQLDREVRAVVKRLRNHPSIALWAGDNECDSVYAHAWGGERIDPNKNVLTRHIIPEALRQLDPTRVYLPSSPYVDEEAYRTMKPISEDHLWGPRDYFKGDYYKNTVCHFASETGYHGCPSPASLAKYIDQEHLWPCVGDRQWLVHAATMDGRADSAYGYRIKLMWDQVETLFGKDTQATDNLDDFSRASQISQAEAKKYFIERFRLSKWRRTGIIWWNLIDGWPQISDAVVDYYLDKKLAYHYIKRSQQPVCLMMDEPCDGCLTLYAVNDTQEDKTIRYTLTDDHDAVVRQGEVTVPANTSLAVDRIPATNDKRYYLIRWEGDAVGMNHYFENLLAVDYGYYQTLLARLEGAKA